MIIHDWSNDSAPLGLPGNGHYSKHRATPWADDYRPFGASEIIRIFFMGLHPTLFYFAPLGLKCYVLALTGFKTA